jgi:hypothetical protein
MLGFLDQAFWVIKLCTNIVHGQQVALVSDLVKSVKEIVMQLATRGEIIQDAMVIHIILNVLPSSYETFVQTSITQD